MLLHNYVVGTVFENLMLYINHYRLNYHKANLYNDMCVFQYNISMACHNFHEFESKLIIRTFLVDLAHTSRLQHYFNIWARIY